MTSMTTPHRETFTSSATASDGAEFPPVSRRTLPHTDPFGLPRRPRSVATTATTASFPRVHSPSLTSHSRYGAARNLRTPTFTRRAGHSSTPRTRLARGGPPRVSVRERRRRHPPPDPPTLVRYHWSTIIILALYLPLLIIPWVIICILDVKPLTWQGTSYNISGWYTPDDIAWVPRWVRASNILACVSSALAFPVVTTVLSHVSVAIVQNVRAGQRLNARDLLALADGCWMRIHGDRRTWLANVGSMLIVLGESVPSLLPHPWGLPAIWVVNVVLAVGMVIPLVQISAVRVEEVKIAACNDVPHPKNPNRACHKLTSLGYTVGGYDPEPADLAYAPGNLVARKVRNRLPTLSNLDSLDHIWPNTAGEGDNWASDWGNTLYYYQKASIKPMPFYVSNFPQTFNTGVLREHALRFNSTASCELVPRASFPDICPGPLPLIGQFMSNETQNRFCVPGNFTSIPWTIDRSRQDIVEELWVDNFIPYGSLITNISGLGIPAVQNVTIYCVARTTRGYYELPNNQNSGQAGPLLQDWPDQEELEAKFDDVEALSTKPPAESYAAL